MGEKEDENQELLRTHFIRRWVDLPENKAWRFWHSTHTPSSPHSYPQPTHHRICPQKKERLEKEIVDTPTPRQS